MTPGTGGTTGNPKGVMLSNRNLETMTALALMGYPFEGRPVYLAMAPLTHAAGVMAFPIMALGGEIVIMPKADPTAFLALIAAHKVTHTFLPPTIIYMLLDHPALATTDLSSLQCFWYGAAPISAALFLAASVTEIAKSGLRVREERSADNERLIAEISFRRPSMDGFFAISSSISTNSA